MELALLVGLQASGKSTFCRERLARTHVLVSKDLMPNGRHRQARQLELVRAALVDGRDVVVDNTNVRREDRQALIALGREHGARVVGYVFDSPLAECLRRNASREGRARVPATALYVTQNRFRRPVLDEGFDALWSVRLVEGAPFEVAPYA